MEKNLDDVMVWEQQVVKVVSRRPGYRKFNIGGHELRLDLGAILYHLTSMANKRLKANVENSPGASLYSQGIFGAASLFAGTLLAASLLHILWQNRSLSDRHTDDLFVLQAPIVLPPQAVFIDPQSLLVKSGRLTDPSENITPQFRVHDKSMLSILGPRATLHEIASNESYAFAHEAPIYVPELDELFFCSQNGGHLGFSGPDRNNVVFKLNLADAELAVSGSKTESAANVKITPIDLDESIQMTNGGTGPYKGALLLVNSGRGDTYPPSVVSVNPYPPYNSTIMVDNYHGKDFNSLNDIRVHPNTGNIYFTDAPYGFLQDFRPKLGLPNQVYMLDTKTGNLRVVADGFSKSNGLAFSPDGKTAYIADSGAAEGFRGMDWTLPATIYAFDVDENNGVFTNRRVFAFLTSRVPDGIQVDTEGNVYSSCGDSVHIWNKYGLLLGKIYTGVGSANLVFAGNGRLIILCETKIFMAHIASNGARLTGP